MHRCVCTAPDVVPIRAHALVCGCRAGVVVPIRARARRQVRGLVPVIRSPYVRGMERKGRSRVLAVRSADPVLSLLSALALGAAAGTALVVDMTGQTFPGTRTLADIAADGPRLDELGPGRRGVAVLGSGSVSAPEAFELIERLSASWPATVVRIDTPGWEGTVVPVVPLLPGWMAPRSVDAAVWQPVGGSSNVPGPGPVLPRLKARTARDLLSGRLPRKSRWIDAWTQIWEMPWG